MPFPVRFLTALLLSLGLVSAARAGVYEWTSEQAYFVFNRKTCPTVNTGVVRAGLLTSLAATCKEGALYEANQILNNAEDVADALFFEAARQELFEQATCSAKKVDALLANPKAFEIFKGSLRRKLPALKKLEQEERDLNGTIGHFEETIPRLPLTGVGEDGKEIPPPEDGWNEQRKHLAAMKLRKEKVKEALDALMDTVPFASYSSVKSAIAKMPADPEKDDRARKDFDKGVFKLLKGLQERLPQQTKLVHPGQTLSTTAKEDVVQDEEFFTAVLDKYPLAKADKEAFGCRLDARYGKGRESLDNVLILGSTVAFGPWGAVGRGLSGVGLAARAAASAGRLRAVGTGVGRALRLGATGIILVDSVRDVQRFCALTSPDHLSKAEGKPPTDRTCGVDDVVEELYEKDCASYFIFWGLALNSARSAQKVLGSELARAIDAKGIDLSNKALNAGITYDLLDSYVLTDEEEDKKEKKGDGKKEESGRKVSGEKPKAENDDDEDEESKPEDKDVTAIEKAIAAAKPVKAKAPGKPTVRSTVKPPVKPTVKPKRKPMAKPGSRAPRSVRVNPKAGPRAKGAQAAPGKRPGSVKPKPPAKRYPRRAEYPQPKR